MKSLYHEKVPNNGEDDQPVFVPEGEDATSATVSAEIANAEPQANTDTEPQLQVITRYYLLRESRCLPSRYGQETEQ